MAVGIDTAQKAYNYGYFDGELSKETGKEIPCPYKPVKARDQNTRPHWWKVGYDEARAGGPYRTLEQIDLDSAIMPVYITTPDNERARERQRIYFSTPHLTLDEALQDGKYSAFAMRRADQGSGVVSVTVIPTVSSLGDVQDYSLLCLSPSGHAADYAARTVADLLDVMHREGFDEQAPIWEQFEARTGGSRG